MIWDSLVVMAWDNHSVDSLELRMLHLMGGHHQILQHINIVHVVITFELVFPFKQCVSDTSVILHADFDYN